MGLLLTLWQQANLEKLFKVVTQGVLTLCGLMFSTSVTLDLYIFPLYCPTFGYWELSIL